KRSILGYGFRLSLRSAGMTGEHMTARIIDGKTIAAELRTRVAAEVQQLRAGHALEPGLAVVLVGENPASAVYVRNKAKQTEGAGMRSFDHRLPEQVSEGDLLALLARLNADPAVHGILVQLPLPAHIHEPAVVDAGTPLKDSAAFGPESPGLLAAGRPRFLACTPAGVQQLLLRNNIGLAGKHVVIVGRS